MQGLRGNRKNQAVLRKALVISDDKTLATATAVGGDGAEACFFVVFPDPLKYLDPDGRLVVNNSNNWILVRDEKGNTVSVAPNGGEYSDPIDGILLPDGSNFKVSNPDSNKIFNVQDSTDVNGKAISKVVPEKSVAFFIGLRNFGRFLGRLFTLGLWRSEYEGYHREGDGSQSNTQWWDNATKDVNTSLNDDDPINNLTTDEWNSKIQEYDNKRRNNNGEQEV